MKQFSYLLILYFFTACGPKVNTTFTKNYAPLDYREEVLVLDVQAPIPDNADNLGTIKIGDTGFSTDCDWNAVIEKAKLEARKVGGNIIKIIEHKPPTTMGSSCHRITAYVLRLDNIENYIASEVPGDVVLDMDYALLHIYRFGGAGALVGYDIHLGDSVICRAKNKWKTTIMIKKDGYNTIWAKTESKVEVPINIQMGHEYYIRCGIKMGFAVGRPTLDLVDNRTGKPEFDSIKSTDVQ